MTNMDQLALQNSEVFREFSEKMIVAEEDQNKKLLSDFDNLQARINENEMLKKAVATLQKKVLEEPGYKETLNSDFVRGLLLMNIEETK
jgi:hypothetical protein